MKYFYYPRRLAQAKEEIKKIHSNEGEELQLDKLPSLKELVFEIEALSEREVEDYSYILGNTQLSMLCAYIPANKYKVKLDNLIDCVKWRFTEKLMRILYLHWQNNYSYKETHRIFHAIQENETCREKLMQEYGVESGRIAEAIQMQSVFNYYMSRIPYENFATMEKYSQSLEGLGLNLEYKLAKDCINEFYFVCSDKAYLELGETDLYKKLVFMNQDQLKKLLLNMLEKMNDGQLDEFYQIAAFYESKTGDYGSQSYADYFDNVNDNLCKKYRSWLNRLKINMAFSLDDTNERSVFWNQYSYYADISFFESTDAVVLMFANSIFVEFREMGPIYHYTKEYYEEKVSRAVHSHEKATKLKYFLYHSTAPLKRKMHIGYWQYDIARQINKYEHIR